MIYTYTIRTPSGRIVNGQGEYDNFEDMRASVVPPGTILISYQESKPGIFGSNIGLFEKKANDLDIATLSEQMSVMLNAGAGTVQTLREVGMGAEKPSLQRTMKSLEERVAQGSTVSDAMREHPRTFNSLVVALVEAGEASNQMPTMLADLGNMLRKDAELKAKLRSAMVYPGFTLGLAVLMTYVMLVKLVPQFAGFLTEVGGKMPVLTQIVINVSNILQRYQWPLILVLFGGGYILSRYRNTDAGRQWWDSMLLKTPIIGIMIRDVTIARLSRAISLLLDNGVQLPQVVRILDGIADNVHYQNALKHVGEGIRQGDQMSVGMKEYPKLFTPMMTSMLAIGEESGSMARTMESTALHYDREANHRADNLAKAVEPLMMIFVGALVGTIVIAMFLPMVALIQALQ